MTASHEVVFGSTALEAGAFVVRRLKGVEAISQPFELELILETSEPADLADDEVDDILSKTAYVAFGAAREHRLWGAIRSIEMLSVATANEHVQYRAVLVPRLWTLSLTRKSRVYLDLRTPEIVKNVFTQNGMTEGQHYRLALTAPAPAGEGSSTVPPGVQGYPVRPYTVQYQETDLAFVSRLLEAEGISYHFEHDEDGGDKLVLLDANTSFPEIADPETVTYSAGPAISGGAELVRSLSREQRMIPRKMHVREHDWRLPRQLLSGSFDIDARGRGEHVRFGDHYLTAADAGRIARIRGQEIQADKVVFRGRSTMAALRAGHTFTLHGHPMPELAEIELLVTRVQHETVQPGAGGGDGVPYANTFEAIPRSQAFRPARLTPKPKIPGVMMATIYGDRPGTAAPIDADGSYQVVFPFDAEPAIRGAPSTRIRMVQSFTGNTHGIHFPLHIGTEVMIAHIDGDPDRPVIVGAAPNKETRSPVTSTNPATESIIQTRAGIHVELEDDA